MSDPSQSDEMTIDELARASGLVTSTVRMYQNRGLLPPPVKRGRVGYYGERHLGRLRLIAQLQERGFSLAAIKDLVGSLDRGESLRSVLGLREGPSTWTAEKPEAMAMSDLAARLPKGTFDAAMIQRVADLGLVQFSDDGSEAEVKSPSFLEVGGELVAMGVPASEILDEYEKLRGETDRIAQRFTELFRAHLWQPFVEDDMPAARAKPMIDALEKLGPLAEAVVVMCLRYSLQEAAERFIASEADRLGIDIPRPGN